MIISTTSKMSNNVNASDVKLQYCSRLSYVKKITSLSYYYYYNIGFDYHSFMMDIFMIACHVQKIKKAGSWTKGKRSNLHIKGIQTEK